MKRCRNITCWTDYPFLELGDTPYQLAPVRRVKVLSYDGNKYAKVVPMPWGMLNSALLTVKAGYLYTSNGRDGQVKAVNVRKLERMI